MAGCAARSRACLADGLRQYDLDVSDASRTRADLSGVFAKLERADEHLQSLRHEVQTFLEQKPVDVVHEWNDSTLISLTTARIAGEPPHRLGVIVGDCVHNLRSSLDHLINSLVISAGREPNNETAFPIFNDREKFRVSVKRRRQVDGLTEPMKATVERLQPFNSWPSEPIGLQHPLRVLHTLWNWDKHRLLIPCIVSVEGLHGLTFERNADVGELISHSVHPSWEPIQDGTVLRRVRYEVGGPQPKIVMRGELEYCITIGSGPRMLETLEAVQRYVRSDVLPAFSHFG